MEEGSLIGQIASWSATGTGILAAVLVSLNLGVRVTGWAFVVFTVSSVAWIATALMRDQTPLLIQNGVMFVINLVGVYRYLIHPSREVREQMEEEDAEARGDAQATGSAGATAAA